MPYLEFDNENRPVGPGVLTIGSGSEAAWRIRDHDLLPVHAIVAPASGGDALVSRGHGEAQILVNGRELTPDNQRVRFGDVIQLNSARLVYRQLAQEMERAGGFLRDVRRNRTYRLRDRATIGRDFASEVLVQEPDVSRQHALLWRADREWFVEPVARAYVLLNGERITAPVALKEGDELSVGKTTLRFTTQPHPEATTAESRRFSADKRTARLQTTYMTTVEMHERAQRSTQRKVYTVIAILIAATAVVAMLLG